ncbi:methyl-accepting chemotaxis protein [Shewanella sp. NFH-SH190041]|uniref:methyl-accepting chemotaxis protein n=1 Tax=Shewanella sp. NFH-SH190041 TaxID=2950245 RepID=UPI0021C3DC45|nr:methyl-accepting chemotaxis protein [Shewanella sp. NFH-SH190041]BDM65607.1 methyl-accepting chemotaxis protein [Shewanella sp. NFH-SH190041]
MSTLSLKQKILLPVTLALCLIILLLSWNGYHSQKQQLIKNSFNQIQRLGNLQAQQITSWLLSHRNVVSGLAESISNQNLLSSLRQAKISGQFQMTYYGQKDGQITNSNPSVKYANYDPRNRPWYQQAEQQQKQIVTNPYMGKSNHCLVITIAQPITHGVVGADVAIDSIIQNIVNMKLPAAGFAILMQNDGTVIAYKDAAKTMLPVSEIDNNLSHHLLEASRQQQTFLSLHLDSENADKLIWAEAIPGEDWQLLFVLDKSALEMPLQHMLVTELLIALSVLLFSVAVIYVLISRQLKPLTHVGLALENIADGNGDLTRRIEINNDDEVGKLASSFNRFVGSQHKLISHIRQLSIQLGSDADTSLENNRRTAEELSRQQQEVNMVATAVTEMTSATQEIAQNAEQTATAAQQSSISSQQGKALVEQTRSSITSLANEVEEATSVIGELSCHAKAISGVLSTIQGIAEQTNLLALNAAIEAARAGEQGRGFAVVADEVRELSHRTQESTKKIHATIETLQNTTANAVELMQASQLLAKHSVSDADAAAGALEEISTAVALISDMAGQIATAAEEQTQVTAEITQNTVVIKDVTDEIFAGASQGYEQAKLLKNRAEELANHVSTFRL